MSCIVPRKVDTTVRELHTANVVLFRSYRVIERFHEQDFCQVVQVAFISVDGDYVQSNRLEKKKTKKKERNVSTRESESRV